MKAQDVLAVVSELNEEIELKELASSYFLDFLSNGDCSVIKFLGESIWSSEEDERIFDEELNEYEPLRDYLKRIMNKVIDELQEQKF